MKTPNLSRRLTKRTYRLIRILVCLFSVLILAGLVLFVVLRIYGVPAPLVRKIIQKVNAAGIHVEVEGITLTREGWRADKVRYYSSHPDDLNPLFKIEQLFFGLQKKQMDGVPYSGWIVDAEALDIDWEPSKEWRLEIPAGSKAMHVDQAEVTLGFFPDRIEFSDGKIDWMGIHYALKGTVLKGKSSAEEPSKPLHRKTTQPPLVTEKQFSEFERRLKQIELPNGANAEIVFFVNCMDFPKSTLTLDAQTLEARVRGVDFAKGNLSMSYAHPLLKLKQVRLLKDNLPVQLSGEYNLSSRQLSGSLNNSITTTRLLLLLPEGIHELIQKYGIQLDHLPTLQVDFGPSVAKELGNHIAGSFSVRNAAYKDIQIDELSGRVSRKDNRIDFSELQGSVSGQESRSAEVRSSMRGGSVSGEVFWDGNNHEFGVKGDLQFDPNLLVGALSRIPIATNIIHRFRFKDQPPSLHLELGSSVTNWSEFYIDTRVLAKNASFQGVECSSINATTSYKHRELKLTPVAVVQGAAFAKASTTVDFNESEVSFDIQSSLNMVALEDLCYPALGLFGHTIKTDGKTEFTANGVFNWDSITNTDFSAKLAVNRFEIPQAAMDRFSADIVGKGSKLSVEGAEFSIYDGSGSGTFSIDTDPSSQEIPYKLDADFSKVNLKKFLKSVSTNEKGKVSGVLSGNIHFTADLATNFLAAAKGAGTINIDKGQLTDLPLFKGFSGLVRKVIPGFKVFSITSLRGDFTVADGVVASDDVYFGGNLLSARGKGNYCVETGFDAYVYAQMFNESRLTKVIRMVTDPLMKFLQFRLEGTASNPSWSLQKLPHGIFPKFKSSKE